MEQLYRYTVELTVQHVNSGAYARPVPVVLNVLKELDQLRDLKLIDEKEFQELRYKLHFCISGS